MTNKRLLLLSNLNNIRLPIFVVGVVAITTFFLLINNLLLPDLLYDHMSAAYIKAVPAAGGPTLSDPNLKAQIIFKGLHNPTSMALLGPNDILVLEKNTGNVIRIVSGKMSGPPLLHVNVATEVERGLLGIAIQKSANPHVPTYVFLYYTEAGSSNTAIGNRLYRYELVNNNQLVNPKLLLSLPAIPADPTSQETNHNGGKVAIGPDGNVYTIIGDVGSHNGQAQNIVNGAPLDGTGGVLRVTQDGQAVANPPLDGGGGNASNAGQSTNLNPNSNMAKYYYAYGIRNSFGMGFDPVSGKLWDTENGPSNWGDEINLVDPGFNSGWNKIAGIWLTGGESAGPGPVAPLHPTNLVDFGGKGKYRTPELSWFVHIAPTALTFLNSSKLGKQYDNDMFVGDVLTGNLYNFKLTADRTGLALTGPLAGKVAVNNTPTELASVIFGKGFGVITDLQVGPDGYLYVLGYDGTIYRIVPSSYLSSP
jgi:glucose/arabinose dehydrogenase